MVECVNCAKFKGCDLSSPNVNECADYTEKLTNEEYVHSLNTEQLADVFFDYRYINATPQQQLWLSANEDFVKGGIVEWLKQPHIPKE